LGNCEIPLVSTLTDREKGCLFLPQRSAQLRTKKVLTLCMPFRALRSGILRSYIILSVPDPGKGVCADPVNGAAILGKEGPDPRGGNKER
jgi:hypothetical protein